MIPYDQNGCRRLWTENEWEIRLSGAVVTCWNGVKVEDMRERGGFARRFVDQHERLVGDVAHLLRISTARQRSGRCTCNHSLFVGTDGIHHRLSPLALPERSRRLPSKPPSSPLDRASEV